MNDSFFEARGFEFQTSISFDEIENLPNCKIIIQNDRIFIHFKTYTDFNFLIAYETTATDSTLLKKNKYFMKSIYLQDEFNAFEREAMFQMVYSLIKDKDYKFRVVAGGWFPEHDDKLYSFIDLQKYGYIK